MTLRNARRITSDNIWRFLIGRRGQEHRVRNAVRRAGLSVAMSAPAAIMSGHWWPLAAWPSVAVAMSGHRTWGYVRNWSVRRNVHGPAMAVIDPVIRHRSPSGHGVRHLDIPRDFRDREGAEVILHLPMDWTPGERADMAKVTALLTARLSADTLTASWHLSGRKPYVSFALPAKPPDAVTWESMLTAANNCKDTDLIMGQGPRGGVCPFSLAVESPHLMLAAGSGAGKSELLAWLVGQFMRRGYGVLVLDAKFVSHMWLRRVPGVLYAAESEELHEALVWLDGELLRRARFVSAGGSPDELIPLVTVLEEINGASNRLRSYWKTIKTKEDPAMSPALTALANLANMGREMRVHILLAGQSVTAKATGGPEGRESFGGRALARATQAQWRMLAPQIKPAPAKVGAPGRWHLVVGDTLREFQAPFCDIKGRPERLIAWATGAAAVPDVPAMMLGMHDQVVVDANADIPWSGTTTCTLPEYARRAEVDLKRLENWRSQDREAFPMERGRQGRAHVYAERELDEYVTARLG